MAKKVVLFLSDPKSGDPRTYQCPDGNPVQGVQTNEAPVKYLLRAHTGIKTILCVVTPLAQATLPILREAVKAQAPAVIVKEIPFENGADFAAGPLARIMEEVQKGDEILLELTGGPRDAIMQLLLTSRALSYSGIPTAGAVYANLGAKEIVDCSQLIRFFDLVGGMQELTSFGRVTALRAYYQDRTEPEITALLDAMERLNESITLCRTGKIDQHIAAFNAAMESAQSCSDPLMRALLPAFRAKFGRKLNVPSLIRWCLGSDMIQQALTIYKERIAAYILNTRSGTLVEPVPRARLTEREAKSLDLFLDAKKDYETEEEIRFRMLLNLGNLKRYQFYDETTGVWQVDPAVLTLEYLDELAPRSYHFQIHCAIPKLRAILMDYQYIRILRNMTNHANDESTSGELLEYLVKQGYPQPEEAGVQEVKQVLNQALDHLKT